MIKAFVAWCVRRRTNDVRVVSLRRALADAIDHCPKCKGFGNIAMPGAYVACSVCTPWRWTLAKTK